MAERIAKSLEAYAYPVLEVGPGMVLTQYLMPIYPDVRAVEIDKESVICYGERISVLRGFSEARPC